MLDKKIPLYLKILFTLLLVFVFYRCHYLFLKQSFFAKAAEDSLRPKYWSEASNKALDTPAIYGAETGIFLAQKLVDFHNKNLISDPQEIEKTGLKIAEFLENYGKKYAQDLTFPLWEAQVYLVLAQRVDASYFVKAESAAIRATDISPRKQEVWFVLGRIYLVQKSFEKSVNAHQVAVNIDPSIAIGHWYLGLSLAANGKNKEAIQEIEISVQKGQALSIEEKLYLVDLLITQKQYKKIIDIFKELKQNDPNNVNWYIKLAATYAAAGDKKQALSTVNEALKIDPSIKNEANAFIKTNNLE